MASKTGKKANLYGKKKDNTPVEKDDGTRWLIMDLETKTQVYGGTGIMRPQAERLATGLVRPAYLKDVTPTSE